MAKKSEKSSASADLSDFEEGLRALYAKKWARAAKLFEKVVESCDRPEIAERARQHLAAANARRDTTPSEAESDRYLKAVYQKNRGDLAEALETCTGGGAAGKEPRFAYLAASIHALEGREEEAKKTLEKAIELDPTSRVHAYHDPDFAELREDGRLAEYFEVA